MHYTDKNTMYLVDYESGSSEIQEFMTGMDLNRLYEEEKNGSVRILTQINLGIEYRK